jgi:hypothetical protein
LYKQLSCVQPDGEPLAIRHDEGHPAVALPEPLWLCQNNETSEQLFVSPVVQLNSVM